MTNNIGPKTDPCGNPWSNRVQELNVVLILTLCHLSCKLLNRTLSAPVESHTHVKLAMGSSRFIVYKALDKSPVK